MFVRYEIVARTFMLLLFPNAAPKLQLPVFAVENIAVVLLLGRYIITPACELPKLVSLHIS